MLIQRIIRVSKIGTHSRTIPINRKTPIMAEEAPNSQWSKVLAISIQKRVQFVTVKDNISTPKVLPSTTRVLEEKS